jgi:hypothetical protein
MVGKPHGNKPCGKQDVNERIILQQTFKTTECANVHRRHISGQRVQW